jgi:DNA-binding transcriptional MerR regulator
MSDGRTLNIGEVIDRLRDEFPDVTVSKLRFLEAEGLLHPTRSRSGYRQFRKTDIERVRYILRQQRDHFLPLRVIKKKLDTWERGEEPLVPLPDGPPPAAYFAESRARMTASELARSAGVAMELIGSLVEHGVIDPRQGEKGPEFGDDHKIIVQSAHRLVSYGLEPRHLRSLRLASNRETDLLTQLAGPLLRHPSPANRQRAAEILADCAQAAREMQDAMVRLQLRSLVTEP